MKRKTFFLVIAMVTAFLIVTGFNMAYAHDNPGKGKGHGYDNGGDGPGKGKAKGHNKGGGSDDTDTGDDSTSGKNTPTGDADTTSGTVSNGNTGRNPDGDRYKAPVANVVCHCDYPLNYWFDDRCVFPSEDQPTCDDCNPSD